MKLNLVTVTNRITTLKQMLHHYKDVVDEIYVVVYQKSQNDIILEDIKSLGITPYKVVNGDEYQFENMTNLYGFGEPVTNIYNEVKSTKPDDWWIVADDDEFHIYPKPIREMIMECEENGWEFITGGFIDRIGECGNFSVVNPSTNLWQAFPYAGFFRYPMSGACPNKVCVMKGRVQVSNGQHYAVYDGKSVWGIEGTKHPKRYPVEKGFVQVHHFKWDSTVLDRLEKNSNITDDYTYWKEHRKMYNSILRNNGKINLNNPNFLLEKLEKNSYIEYSNWNILTTKIIQI
jgi:hypothetical protein